ncbi:MAG: hypothetical protein J6B77_02255, partial [Clostridia bacterium]|nr:hypothetical protein [Clostridia bacterium]
DGTLDADGAAYDTDAVVLDGDETDPSDSIAAGRALGREGLRVRAEHGTDTKTRAKAVYRMNGREAKRV